MTDMPPLDPTQEMIEAGAAELREHIEDLYDGFTNPQTVAVSVFRAMLRDPNVVDLSSVSEMQWALYRLPDERVAVVYVVGANELRLLGSEAIRITVQSVPAIRE